MIDPEKKVLGEEELFDNYLMQLAQEDLHIVNQLKMESVIDTLSSW